MGTLGVPVTRQQNQDTVVVPMFSCDFYVSDCGASLVLLSVLWYSEGKMAGHGYGELAVVSTLLR